MNERVLSGALKKHEIHFGLMLQLRFQQLFLHGTVCGLQMLFAHTHTPILSLFRVVKSVVNHRKKHQQWDRDTDSVCLRLTSSHHRLVGGVGPPNTIPPPPETLTYTYCGLGCELTDDITVSTTAE